MSGYSIAELEVLYGLSKFGERIMLGGGSNPTLYDSAKYRFAVLAYMESVLGVTGYRDPDTNWGGASDPILLVDPSRIRINALGKADCVGYMERVTPAIVKVAIENYTTKPSLAALQAIFQDLGFISVVAAQLAQAIPLLWSMVPGDLGAQVLSNPSTFASTWTRSGDFAISGDALVYTHSGGTGGASQAEGDFNITDPALDAWHKLDYTVSGAAGTKACTITTAFAAAAVALDLTNGRHTVVFKSNASTISAFTLAGTSSPGGAFTIDDVELNEIQSNANTGQTRTLEVGATVLPGYSLLAPQFIAQIAIGAVYELRSGEMSYYAGGPIV